MTLFHDVHFVAELWNSILCGESVICSFPTCSERTEALEFHHNGSSLRFTHAYFTGSYVISAYSRSWRVPIDEFKGHWLGTYWQNGKMSPEMEKYLI